MDLTRFPSLPLLRLKASAERSDRFLPKVLFEDDESISTMLCHAQPLYAKSRASRSLVPRNPIIIPSTDKRLSYPRLVRRKWLPINSPHLSARIRVADAGALSDVPDTDRRVGATIK